MNSKKLVILSVVALLAVVIGVWLASERTTSDTRENAALYPDLAKNLDKADAVRIFTAGDKLAVEIARKDSEWRVSQRNDYPADEPKVRKLLVSLADAKLREQKTSNAENYTALGVEDVSGEKASGVRIEIGGVEPAVNLIVGKRGPGLESQYVRRAGEAQSWLIDADIDKSSSPQDWLRKSILDVGADRIQSATIQTGNAKPYSATKNSRADADFAVSGIPKGKELSSPSAANSLATALSNLTLSDVQPAASDTKPAAHATYRTFDGLVVELDGWSRDDKYYLAARTSYDPELAERFKLPSAQSKDDGEDQFEAGATEEADDANETEGAPAQSDDNAETETAKADSSTKKNVEKEAKDLAQKLSGWAYEIPKYKYDQIFKPLDELLKD